MTALRDDFQDSDPTAVDHAAHHNALAAEVNGLANVDDTADADKPVSTAQQAAIDAASTTDRDRANHTGVQLAATVSDFAAAADARITVQKGAASGLAPLDAGGHIAWIYLPADAVVSVAGRTGVVVLVKADVGLSSVDNTADTTKPVSTAQQAALDLKAAIASPTFTGTVGGISKAMVGLGSVDNTADSAKPVSTAQAAADALKANAAAPALTGIVTFDADANLYRFAAGMLKTDGSLIVLGGHVTLGTTAQIYSSGSTVFFRNATDGAYVSIDVQNATVRGGLGVTGAVTLGPYALGTTKALTASATGDALDRFFMDASGRMLWGSGALSADTNLYRNGAAILKTDSAFVVAGTLQALGTLAVTGAATAPTAAPGTNTTQVATTAYVTAAAPPDLLTTGEETLSRLVARDTTLALTSGKLLLSYFTARKTETVTQVRINSGSTAAGATPTTVLIGVYSVAGNGDLTLVASTANDTSLLAATGTAYTKALQASFAKVAGTRYALGVLVVTSQTAPTVPGMFVATAAEAAVAPRLAGSLTGQTGLPTPITAASVVNTSNVMYGVVLP